MRYLAARAILAALALQTTAARATDIFSLDQTNGSIRFSVDHFGSFTSEGRFPRFSGRLVIDRARPEATTIDVMADAASVTIPWPDGAALLRGPEFFDAGRFQSIRFTSGSITPIDASHFRIIGTLEIRGIRHPLTLEAMLRKRVAEQGRESADFSVTGVLSRAAYGMTTQSVMISDQVRLLIDARIALPMP